jgi:carboxypeptidase PM20D1
MGYALLIVGLGLVLLICVLFFRTLRLTSMQMRVDQAGEIAFDGQAAAARLAAALRFETISSEDLTQVPAEALISLHRHLEKSYPRVHNKLSKELVGNYSLLYTWEGPEEGLNPILLLAHMDVVPVEPKTAGDWTYAPFDGEIAEGFVWGRGSMDDKVAVTGILEAAELLLSEGFQPQRTIYLAFGHDEEIGGLRGAALIGDLLRSRGVEPGLVLDEGLLIAQGVVPKVPKPVALVGIAEKGYVSVELTVKGAGGHSSMPPQETPVGILSTAIHKLEKNHFPARLDGPVKKMFDFIAPEMPFGMKMVFANLWLFGGLVENRLAASPATNAAVRTTTAATIFEGGAKENLLPAQARAVVNFRILPGGSIASVIDHVRGIIDDSRVQLKSVGRFTSEPSPISDLDSPSFQVLQRTIHQVFPDVLVAPGLVLGATDSRHYSGLSRNVYRFSPLRARPEDLERVHGTNERVSVEDYGQIVKFYVQLMRNSASQVG